MKVVSLNLSLLPSRAWSDLACGELGVDPGHKDLGDAAVQLGESLGIGGLGRVVDLAVDQLAEIVDHLQGGGNQDIDMWVNFIGTAP